MYLADVLEERKEHGADIPRRPEAIHLYGVDCMSTSECLSYFGDYGPTFVEWIDDSSCNVLFEDEFTTKRALIGRGKPLPPDNSAPDTAGMWHLCSILSPSSQLCSGSPCHQSCSTKIGLGMSMTCLKAESFEGHGLFRAC